MSEAELEVVPGILGMLLYGVLFLYAVTPDGNPVNRFVSRAWWLLHGTMVRIGVHVTARARSIGCRYRGVPDPHRDRHVWN